MVIRSSGGCASYALCTARVRFTQSRECRRTKPSRSDSLWMRPGPWPREPAAVRLRMQHRVDHVTSVAKLEDHPRARQERHHDVGPVGAVRLLDHDEGVVQASALGPRAPPVRAAGRGSGAGPRVASTPRTRRRRSSWDRRARIGLSRKLGAPGSAKPSRIGVRWLGRKGSLTGTATASGFRGASTRHDRARRPLGRQLERKHQQVQQPRAAGARRAEDPNQSRLECPVVEGGLVRHGQRLAECVPRRVLIASGEKPHSSSATRGAARTNAHSPIAHTASMTRPAR